MMAEFRTDVPVNCRQLLPLIKSGPMQVLLRCSAKNKPEKKIKVSRDVLIGREKGGCDLRVASSEVSRKHCQILVGDQAVAVRDLGSANGTRVNDERIPPKTSFPVNSGDVIAVGPLSIIVEFRGAKTQKPKQPAKTSDPAIEVEDEFHSQDDALAALDMPAFDVEQSAAEILIESRLVDSGDDYGSGLETVEKPADDANADGFDYTPSGDVPVEQFSPIKADLSGVPEPLEVPELEPVEELDPVEELEPVAPDPAAIAPVATPAPASPEEPPAEETKEKKKRGLKSLFGRKKKKTDAAPEATPQPPAEEPVPPAEPPLAMPELPAADSGDVVPLAEAPQEEWEPDQGEWEAEDELVSVEDMGSIDGPIEEAAGAPFGVPEEVDDLEEVEELELDDEPAEPVDPGFSDFLNQFEEPQ